ncbi:Capsular polysaccharide biosynthesis protein [Promicromonospora thailandica]|uniref:Capsular polysaccharide biosynthesis protein n=1 Tax=Promicromonospora thailandica TaxID=765201 RepID=A0A9X2JX05_9MICO|nr:Capsular polysaccharide biosynthesis protein [Promicromonospora thailandica]
MEGLFPDARVLVLEAGDHDDLFASAAGQPQADLVIDARTDPEAQKYWAFRRLFLGIRDGGHYLVLGVSREDPTTDPTPPRPVIDPYRRPVETTPAAAGLDEWLDRLWDARGWDAPRRRTERLTRFEVQMMSSIADVLRGDDFRLVTKSGEHMLMLDPGATRSALARRGVRTTDIDRRPARTITTPVRLVSNAPEHSAARFPATEDVPELVCRAYDDVVCAPRQVATVAGLMLPDSYVQPWRRPLGQLVGNVTASEYGTAPGLPSEPRLLEGTYFHLDNEVAGHYGHFLTHDLARLWAWDAAAAMFPDLRLLVGGTDGGDTVPGFVLELLAAYGIGADRVTVLTGPTRVERLVTATQAFQQPMFLAPEAASVWSRIRDVLVRSTGDLPVPARVFVARSDQGRRLCRNAAEVERRFADAGFEIVRPELLPLAVQAKIFAQADVVAGYAGSGMINAVWSREPATRMVISSRSYPAINEYHLARHFGSEIHYLWCEPDVPVPPSGMTKKAFHSDFAVDLERDGARLDEFLSRAQVA